MHPSPRPQLGDNDNVIFPLFLSAYCQQLEDMIAEKIDAFTALRDKARNFRTCLGDEEAKSRLLMHRNY